MSSRLWLYGTAACGATREPARTLRSLTVSMALRPVMILAFASCASAQVTTAQYDNARTGANLRETVLTPRNVNPAQFGKLFTFAVDGDVYAQPLYVPRLEIPGKGVHDVVFVATEHDTVYAFDAAGEPRDPLWRVSLLGPGAAPV